MYLDLAHFDDVDIVRKSLAEAGKAVAKAAAAIAALPKGAKDILLHTSPAAFVQGLFGASSSVETQPITPMPADEAVDARRAQLFEKLWGPERRDLEAEHISWEGRDMETWPVERLEAAQQRQLSLQASCTHPESNGRRETCPFCQAADREFEAASLQFSMTSAPGKPSPYEIITKEVSRLGDLASFIQIAEQALKKTWRNDERRGRRGKMREIDPKRYICGALLDVVKIYFRVDGLNKIHSQPKLFWSIVSAIIFYSSKEDRDHEHLRRSVSFALHDEIVSRLRELGVGDAHLPSAHIGRPRQRKPAVEKVGKAR